MPGLPVSPHSLLHLGFRPDSTGQVLPVLAQEGWPRKGRSLQTKLLEPPLGAVYISMAGNAVNAVSKPRRSDWGSGLAILEPKSGQGWLFRQVLGTVPAQVFSSS